MHQSFTGSSRRARQVNLSGRNPNPWATTPLAPNSSKASTASGTQLTVAQAQADRLRRHHDRERLNASKTIQKVWRGHASRQHTRQERRAEWDAFEEKRRPLVQSTAMVEDEAAAAEEHDSTTSSLLETRPYATAGECFAQLRLLTHFVNVKLEMDARRLLFFGASLHETLQVLPSLAATADDDGGDGNASWTVELARLANLTLRLLEERLLVFLRNATAAKSKDRPPSQAAAAGAAAFDAPLDLLVLLAQLVPKDLAAPPTAKLYYRVLADVLRQCGAVLPSVTIERVLRAVVALLSPITPNTLTAYMYFGTEFLVVPDLQASPGVLEYLESTINYKLLAKALHQALSEDGGREARTAAVADTDGQLWLLAYFIFLHRHSFGASQKLRIAQESDSITVISTLLGHLSDEIELRIKFQADLNAGYIDGPRSESQNQTQTSLAPFVMEQINTLRQQDSITEILSYIGLFHSSQDQTSNENESNSEIASSLAKYLLTLLRVFSSRAYEIRMWLYKGSADLKASTGSSAIHYFWSASRKSSVFRKILQSHKAALPLLKASDSSPTNQFGKSPISPAEIETRKQEWNIILLFSELYSSVLKFMDDEEFLSGGNGQQGSILKFNAPPARDGALPLQDISDLSVFLKNLAFTLYWHASEFDDSDHSEDSSRIGALFGTEVRPMIQKATSNALSGTQGMSVSYVKDVSTGLLRMLHERDSRRNIFPKDHWLMTSQLDLMGFIPAVVAEEEKRHEIQDDQEDDEEEDLDHMDDVNGISGPSTGWDRPNLFQPLARNNYLYGHTHNPRQARYLESLRRKQDQAKRTRQLELLAPRLEILRNLPFFIPFETRVQIFREFVHRDQMRRRNGFIEPDLWRMSVAHTSQGRAPDGRRIVQDPLSRHHAEIRRESIFNDAYEKFYDLGEELKEPIQISFIDKFNTIEAGIDGGGVTKEFLTSVTSDAFDPNYPQSMFVENDAHFLFPNPNAFEQSVESLRHMAARDGTEEFNGPLRELLKRYEFLGRIIGKCMYEGILVDINFAGFFLLKWALTGGTTSASNESAYRANINDLRDLDEGLYQGLLKLKNYPGDVETDFGLNFTVSDSLTLERADGSEFVKNVTHDLIANGANIPVTNARRLMYIDRMAYYRLKKQPEAVTRYFLKGLGMIIQPMWLAMFNQRELQTLVGGDTNELDIADLRRNTQYGGLYVIGDDGKEHETVALFWQVLKEMNDQDRRKVLKFVTSTPRAPLLGFSNLNPRFSIRDSGDDQVRLPSTSTCVNLLKLPRYSDAKTLREKLLYAVNAGAGFDLS